MRLDQIYGTHLKAGSNIGLQIREDLERLRALASLTCFWIQAIYEAQVRHVRFFLPAENMSCQVFAFMTAGACSTLMNRHWKYSFRWDGSLRMI